MEIKEISDQSQWDGFLLNHGAHLLQSWQWGELQRRCGRRVWRLAVVADGRFLAAAQIIKYDLPLSKSYLYCPRGPVGESKLNVESYKLLFKKISKIVRPRDAIFLRVDSEVERRSKFTNALREIGFKMGKRQTQPQDTLFLDLTKSEEDLLADMHHKARYNIRLAGRKKVTIRQSTDLVDVDKFYTLMKATTERDQFSAHPLEYYRKQVAVLGQNDLVKLFLAEHKGEVIAAAIVSFYADRAVYLHGASSYEHRKLMAPHSLQWEAIREARQRGLKYYDFGGIAPADADKNHPWSGITRFKRGFGGEEKNWAGVMELPYQSSWYWGYNLFRK